MTANTFGTLDILMKHSKQDHLEEFLPGSLLLASPHPEDVPLQSLSFSMCWLATVHPTWICVAMTDFPAEIQRQILAWLPSSLTQELLPLLPGIGCAERRCSSFGAFYLLNLLSKKIRPPGITEEIFLPASPFNAMLYYSGTTKMDLINFLGLHSLAKELRHVVDKILIKRVHRQLSHMERVFLEYCRSHPMRHLEPTAFLSFWEDDTALRTFIHRQGLIFLAQALAKEDASFLWYFLRRLDVNRGRIFEQALKNAYESSHVEYFRNALEECIKILVQ